MRFINMGVTYGTQLIPEGLDGLVRGGGFKGVFRMSFFRVCVMYTVSAFISNLCFSSIRRQFFEGLPLKSPRKSIRWTRIIYSDGRSRWKFQKHEHFHRLVVALSAMHWVKHWAKTRLNHNRNVLINWWKPRFWPKPVQFSTSTCRWRGNDSAASVWHWKNTATGFRLSWQRWN